MAKAIGLDGLAEAISEILEEYQTEVQRGTKECVQKVAKAGVKALKDTSPKRTGGYAAGWAAKIEEDRMGATATIYNADKPGLVHLLEHGHVTRNGTGRTFRPTPAHVHVKPVEEKLNEDFEKQIEVVISR